jgi:predicted kinase
MPTLVEMVGLPGTGKTSTTDMIDKWTNSNGYLTDVINSDTIRYQITGSYSDMSKNNLVFSTMFKEILTTLNKNRSIIIDATNTVRQKRCNIIKSLKDTSLTQFNTLCIALLTPFETVVKNCARKYGDAIPEEKLREWVNDSYDLPIYIAEPWQDIIYIPYGKCLAKKESLETYIEDNIDKDNLTKYETACKLAQLKFSSAEISFYISQVYKVNTNMTLDIYKRHSQNKPYASALKNKFKWN